MLKVCDMPAPAAPELLERLGAVDPTTIGHFRHYGFVDPEIRALIPGRRVVGTAVTVCMPAIDSALLHYVVSRCRPGDVLVIDRLGDRRHACMGGVVAAAMKVAGIAAVILDGLACDFTEIRELDLPVWCRGEAVLTAKFMGVGGAINIPVSCGGVAVTPGDIVLADSGGVLVLPPDPQEVDYCIERALSMQAGEPAMLKDIRAGGRIGDISGANQRLDALLAAQDEEFAKWRR